MMERRLGVVLGLTCVLGVVSGCQGSADDADGEGQDNAPAAGNASAGGGGVGGSSNPSSGGAKNTAGTSAGRGGTPGAAAGSGGSMGLAGSGLGRAGAAAGGSGGGLLAECDPKTTPTRCVNDTTISGCSDGLTTEVSCADVCGAAFIASCDSDEDLCLCEPRDLPCFDGAAAFCECARLSGVIAQCTFEEVNQFYEACTASNPANVREVLLCFEGYVTVTSPEEAEVDCDGANMECLPQEP